MVRAQGLRRMTDPQKWRQWSTPENIAEYEAIDAAEALGVKRKRQIRDAAYKMAKRAAKAGEGVE